MTPNQHTMLNRLRENVASIPVASHGFVRWLQSRRSKNEHTQLSVDEHRRLISLHNKLLEQGVVEQLETA